MKKRKLALALAVTALITACSSGDDGADYVVCPVVRPISVEIDVDVTRASVIETSTLQHFYMYGAGTTYEVTRQTNGTWTISPDNWPSSAEDDKNVTFYAYNTDAASDFDSSGNNVTLSVAEDAFAQKDLLVATTTTSYDATGGSGKVSLTFDHVCTAPRVSLTMTNTLRNALGSDNLKVTKVLLRDIKKSGKYSLTTGEWTVNDETTNYTLTNNTDGITVTTEQQFLPCDYLFLIPQSLNGASIDVTYQIGAKEPRTKNILLNKTLEKGNTNPINIPIGTSFNYE